MSIAEINGCFGQRILRDGVGIHLNEPDETILMVFSADSWRMIREEVHTGPMNMALDEVAANSVAAGGPRTLRVYRWNPSTLSLGYGQDSSSIDWDYCEKEGISTVRRQTGGGAIYHDRIGDLSYSIIAPAGDLPENLLACYKLLCTPILDAFERMGVPAFVTSESMPGLYEPACYLRELHPSHDIVVRTDSRTKKISGNAQYRQQSVIIQHGSLTFKAFPTRHLSCFSSPTVDKTKFRTRVTDIHSVSGIDRASAVSALERALFEWANATEGSWTDEELLSAHDRAEQKFASDSWTFRCVDPLVERSKGGIP